MVNGEHVSLFIAPHVNDTTDKTVDTNASNICSY